MMAFAQSPQGAAPTTFEKGNYRVRTTEGTEEKTLELACAPAEERPAGEAGGMCSHFVAAAPWMKNDDRLEVRVTLPLLSGETPYTWRRFDPLRYAHHIE